MNKLEVAKKIVANKYNCMSIYVDCNDCPAFDIVNEGSPFCTLNWDEGNTLEGIEYHTAKIKWFENWIKENETE